MCHTVRETGDGPIDTLKPFLACQHGHRLTSDLPLVLTLLCWVEVNIVSIVSLGRGTQLNAVAELVLVDVCLQGRLNSSNYSVG